MDENHAIDKMLEALDHSQRISPSADFLSKMEERALAFAEPRVKYNPKALLGLILIIATVVALNIALINYYSQQEIEATEANSIRDWVPVKTIVDEEN